MAAYVRSIDAKHLITIGSEGFYAAPSASNSNINLTQYNPQDWAKDMGQDFIANTNIPQVCIRGAPAQAG